MISKQSVSNKDAVRLCMFSKLMSMFNNAALSHLSAQGRVGECYDAVTPEERAIHKQYRAQMSNVAREGVERSICTLRLEDAFTSVIRRVHANDDLLLDLLPDNDYKREDAILLQKQGLFSLADLVHAKWHRHNCPDV